MPASVIPVDSSWRVSFDLEPKSREDRWERAIFFATIISIECARLLVHCLNYCQAGAGAKGSQSQGDMVRRREALKEITCQSIFLSLVEQDGIDAPAWLKEFVADSLAVSDKICAQPQSETIQKKYAAASGIEGNCLSTALNVCHYLAMGEKKEDAVIYLSDCLKEQAPLRAACLSFALKASLSDRDQVIKDAGGKQEEFPDFQISDFTAGL